MKKEIDLIKTEVIKMFIKDGFLETIPIETHLGNELMQRILDAIYEFEIKYEN